MPLDPQPTRQRIIDTATRLLAERGVDAVPLAEINRAAGQRNASALQYHFGGREGLLRAMLEPFARAVGQRRRELIAVATAPGARSFEVRLRQAVEVLVRPQAELAAGDWRERSLSRIVADLFTDPHHPYAELDDLLGERATEEMSDLLLLVLDDLPAPVRRERLLTATAFVIHATSGRARQADDQGPESPGDLFVENLVDMVVGALAAPVSEATAEQASSHTAAVLLMPR
jgi:AcrR family transcriptional regulator